MDWGRRATRRRNSVLTNLGGTYEKNIGGRGYENKYIERKRTKREERREERKDSVWCVG